MIKIGCIVQGDLRVPVEPILRELRKHCDFLVLSTWEDQRSQVPAGDWFCTLYNTPPAVRGITNRNFQRRSTAAGLAMAAAEGCTHVLKWRTDMLPTRLQRDQLLAWSRERPTPGLPGRIVMSAFRNLTVDLDWLSSFPDQFAFGDMALMKLLWSDEEFDYKRDHNLPSQMTAECDWQHETPDWVCIGREPGRPLAQIYDAHVELYALFKSRLQKTTGRTWQHATITRDVLRLIDHRRLGICWLKSDGKLPFRSITRSAGTPWWTETNWIWNRPAPVLTHNPAYSRSYLWWSHARTMLKVYHELVLQCYWQLRYRLSLIIEHNLS